MTTEEKLDRVADNLDHLTTVVSTRAATVAAHDDQIEALIKVGEQHQARMQELAKISERTEAEIQALAREWQAYIKTLRPQ